MDNLAYKDKAYEVLDGKIFYMSPRPIINHTRIIGNIYRIFSNFLFGKKCEPFCDGVEVFLTDKDTVIPDFMVICNKDIIKTKGIYGVPDLIVEVLSPSTAKNDKGYKKDLYEFVGVKEYWIIDINNYSVDVYLLNNGKYELNNIYSILPDYILEDMTDEEKTAHKTEFTTSLYGDNLIIKLEDVFYNVFSNPIEK